VAVRHSARYPLGVLPTPLVPALRLSAALRTEVWVKRDDLIGFAFAGNKTRPLEVLVADALAHGHDILMGCGGPASNFCQGLAAAARVAGLGCHLVLYGEPPGRVHPNLAAMRRFGAEVVFTGDPDRSSTPRHAADLACYLEAAGHRPYLLARGGSTPLGATAYARAADELAGQLAALDLRPRSIALPVGSGGTIAGLLAGTASWDRPTVLTGAVVSRTMAETRDEVLGLARGAARLVGGPEPTEARLHLVDAIGAGCGQGGPETTAGADLALATEGLIVDRSYGSRSLALLGAALGPADGPVILWHTGGWLGAVAELMAEG
jgi:1-aminocyclopropane-1-carboxylate deaminase/D-cysteine desulfhydrase-like pyridoxal-dependent ACC family enzyme